MSAVPPFLLPADEAERLRSLRAYDVQSALDEPVFNEIVALTARIFSLPISLIALVEAEVVHYPVNHGMPGNAVQPREGALCSTAILHNNAVVYRDLAVEINPLITAEAAHAAHQNNLRFYAGAPLRMPGDHNIGTLCVIDHQPRNFSEPEQHTLEQMATLVAHAVTVRHTCYTGPAGEQHWQTIRVQLQEELQGLTALVRYLYARYGNPTPVPADLLAQVERRLQHSHEVLAAQV